MELRPNVRIFRNPPTIRHFTGGFFVLPTMFSSPHPNPEPIFGVLNRPHFLIQMDYILGNNPAKTSYVVGYGNKYPKNVHHRASSIPRDGKKYGCQDGFKWLDNRGANPNTITGAMVAGPDKFDQFKDVRRNYSYTEPTLAGNAGLVAALVSLTTSGSSIGVDKNTIFAAVPPLYPISSPPPPQWKP